MSHCFVRETDLETGIVKKTCNSNIMINAYTNFHLNVNFPFRKHKLFYPIPKGISNHTLSYSKVKAL